MSTVTRMERIEADIQEPQIIGDSLTYADATVQKHAWMCNGCRLIWSMRWHAESCEDRKHVDHFPQEYPSSLLDAYGKPLPPKIYMRRALRREPKAPAFSPEQSRGGSRRDAWDVKARGYIFHIVTDPERKARSLLHACRQPNAYIKRARMREQIVWLFEHDVPANSNVEAMHVCVTPAQAEVLDLPKQ